MSETGPQWRGGTVRASMDGHPPAEREGTATVARAVEGLPTGHRHVWGWLRNSRAGGEHPQCSDCSGRRGSSCSLGPSLRAACDRGDILEVG